MPNETQASGASLDEIRVFTTIMKMPNPERLAFLVKETRKLWERQRTPIVMWDKLDNQDREKQTVDRRKKVSSKEERTPSGQKKRL